MNAIKYTLIYGFLLSGFLIEGIAGEVVSYDLEKIVTLRGRTYRDILILSSDVHGLLFRHRDGIAKLDFRELSQGIRGMYEPVEDGSQEEEPMEELSEGGGLLSDEAEPEVQIDLITRNRVRAALPLCRFAGPCANPPVYCPSYWPRYHASHALVNPRCRAAVLRDFLYTSGLLPLPPGVRVVRLPSPTPWNFR